MQDILRTRHPQEYSDTRKALALKEQGIRKVGMAVFIVDLATKKIWTVTENNNKLSTQRTTGVVTIPLETRKLRETDIGPRLEFGHENLAGALEEFRELLPGEELIVIDIKSNEISSFKGRFSLVEGVAADVVVVGLRNKLPDENHPARTAEVSAAGWKSLDELMESPNLRNGVIDLLRLVNERGWIDSTVKVMLEQAEKVRVMSDDDLSVGDREKFPDMELP
jgi:hypothetical protein